MNILRCRRKSKNKRDKLIMQAFLLIVLLIFTTFAWFVYTKVLMPSIKMHIASWNVEFYIDGEKKKNPISIDIPILYPAMPEEVTTIDIINNGETMVDLDYNILSVSIAGTTYEIVPEGKENSTENYLIYTPSVFSYDEQSGREILKSVIINDLSQFPFTIEVEYCSQIASATEDLYGNVVAGKGYFKVTTNWIGDNDKLDTEWGNKVAEYIQNNTTGDAVLSIQLKITAYQTDPEGQKIESSMPSTSYTTPYLPNGYKRVPGTTLENGLVIEDPLGNQYVWVEVPKTNEVYTNAGLDITYFNNAERTLIENDLQTYASRYRENTYTSDTYYSSQAIGLSEDEYENLKAKMLKSVYQNGGFYIGRYETGTLYSPRIEAGETTQTPVIKENAYPYNYVTCAQAQMLADNLSSGKYTASLMFGLQWDLTMKYLETKAVDKGYDINVIQAILKSDSTEYGNYNNNLWILIKPNTLYSSDGTTWNDDSYYVKENNENILLSTGANSSFSLQNIFDLAGNYKEWTLEYSSNFSRPCIYRGGCFADSGDDAFVTSRGNADSSYCDSTIGFRVTLY